MERRLRGFLDDLALRGGLRHAGGILLSGAVIAVAASGVVGWYLGSSGGQVVAVSEVPPLSIAVPDPASETTPTCRVHVVGAVRTPGVYTLTEGSIVDEAVLAAGGPTTDAAMGAVNLAEIVWDGQQVRIPTDDEVAGSPSVAVGTVPSGTGTTDARPVNVNTADSTRLETLPGIGPATAEKIIADRTKNGRYATLDDLSRVSGIGEKRIEAIRDLAVAR